MSATTPSSSTGRQTTPNLASKSSAAKSPSPSRPATPSKMAPNGTTNGVTRTRSTRSQAGAPISAKSAARKSPAMAAKDSGAEADDGSKAETAALIEDLKDQLRKAEEASEEYQKELRVAQNRLDEALTEQAKLEETTNAHAEAIEDLQHEKQESTKKHKELENIYESEKAASLREREESAAREEDLKDTITRMRETLVNREHRKSMDAESRLSRTSSFRGRSSPKADPANLDSPTLARRDSSRSGLVLQKDKVIEQLRLELAEAQLRLVEVENAGGGRLQELEKTLLETRMANAKLMEDNESFQFLLQEKTLSGELANRGMFHASASPSQRSRATSDAQGRENVRSSLAEELETSHENTEKPPEKDEKRKLEIEITTLKEQNKALALYINKIITKLLQSEQFEALFAEGTVTGDSNPLSAPANTAKKESSEAAPEKELPKPPEEDKDAQPSLLQRAGSLFGGRNRPRPKSYQPQQSDEPPKTSVTGNALTGSPPRLGAALAPVATADTGKPLPNPMEDPATAPSVPLQRGGSIRAVSASHRRAKSDLPPIAANIAAARRPPSRSGSGEQTNPSPLGLGASVPMSPTALSRNPSSFSSNAPPPLILEDNDAEVTSSEPEAPSMLSPPSSDTTFGSPKMRRVSREMPPPPPLSADGSQPPLSPAVSDAGTNSSRFSVDYHRSAAANALTGSAPPTKGGMRPLRLVQEKEEAEEAAEREKRKANRSSFMGWFQRGQTNTPPGAPQQGGLTRQMTDPSE